jgi:microcystin-dependent protein
MTTTVPVGCLVIFGGSVEGVRINELREQGWLLCDGSAYPAEELDELFTRIGNGYGGGEGTFNVPDFRGRFARGTDHGRGKDPDAVSRTALSPGGNTGDKVGSAQAYATGRPVSQFRTADDGQHQHVAAHLTSDYHSTPLSAWGSVCAEWPGSDQKTSEAGDHSHTIAGGDVESRPGNVYGHYLIKFSDIEAGDPPGTASPGAAADPGPKVVAIGTVLPFAGDASDQETAAQLRSQGWFPCFGQPLAADEYKSLFNVVQYFFGGTAGTFSLPDLRGQFVRGARTASRTGPGGTIGTSQGYATMLPLHRAEAKGDSLLEVATAGGHSHTLAYLPGEKAGSYYTAGHTTAEFGRDDTRVDASGSHWHAIDGGGDQETRPVNLYVDFIIKFAEPAPARDSDT